MAVFTLRIKCLAIALAATRSETRQKWHPLGDSAEAREGAGPYCPLFAFPAKVVFAMRSHVPRNHIDLHTHTRTGTSSSKDTRRKRK